MTARIRRFFRGLSLVQKFSLAFIFLIFVMMVTVNTLIINHQKMSLRSEMEGNHLLIVNNLAKDALEPLISTDPLRLDELVRITDQTPGCLYAALVDQEGRILAHTNRKLLGGRDAGGPVTQPLVIVRKGKDVSADNPDDTVKEIRVPVKVGYEVMGLAVAGFSTQGIDAVIEDTMRGLRNHILLVSAIVMAGGIWGSLWLARVLTTPMNRLKEGMEEVQKGNLDVEVPNEYIADCREVLGCDRDNCPAFGKKRCWTVPDTLCFGAAQGATAEKITLCRECTVYRESCGDEIGELIEGFNEMTGKLKKSMEELEETNREKSRLEKLSALGQMSMTVAHEIKNPLNAIRGAVSYLQNNFQGEVLREFLSIIEDETKRLNEIVTSYLRFSKPSPLNLRVADLNDVIGETVELIRQEATENNVEVVTALDDRIPPFSFDPNQFKQALLNILVNALDATKEGDTIRVATEFVDSRAQISVKDTGTGISEEVTSEIFKPFFTTKTRGSGLGLACVERIIRDHRGDVVVTSEAGKGTEFSISLPVDDSRQT